MKKLTLIILFFSALTYAQRASNAYSVYAKAGVNSSNKLLEKFGGSAGVNYILGSRGSFLEAQINYHDIDIKYNESYLNLNVSSLELGAGYSVEEEQFYPFYLNLKGSAVIGYERFNKGNTKEPLYQLDIPYKNDGFIYGFSLSPEIEAVVYENISALLNFTQYFNIKSNYNKSYYNISLGIKYYL